MTVENHPVATAQRQRTIRGDIQALRAIAVILVIFDHLVVLQKLPGSPEGGFIGVDIFFVISGFLITQHLVGEELQKGRISFRNFYIRRIRRILPMALIVIAVTIAASFAIFWPWQATSSARDGLWSALFVSNIAFAIRGVDYFAQGQASIFQHYWSLSVEEQFYFVWPLLLAVAGFFALRRHRPRVILLVTAVTVGALSFLWACIDTAISPTTAYFSTFTRAFEFAIGAVVAILVPSLRRVPTNLRVCACWTGLTLILLSVWLVHPDSGFPGPMAVVPTMAAALVIASGSGTDATLIPKALSNRAVVYTGNISYSLYLWHWPLILFLRAFFPREQILVPLALALTFALSAMSYRYVERPILASGWLIKRNADRADQRRHQIVNRTFARNLLAMSTGILATGAIIAGGDWAVRTFDASRTDTVAAGGSLSLQAQPPLARQFVEGIQSDINSARLRNSWAGLRPDVSRVQPYVGDIVDNCWNRPGDPPRTCVRGNPAAKHTIAVLGDSIALNFSFAIDEFVQQHPDWNMAVYAKLGCPAPQVPTSAPDGSNYADCDQFRGWALNQIRDRRPEAVWLISAVPRKLRGVADGDTFNVWGRGLSQTLDDLAAVPNVFVVTPPPEGRDLAFCSRPFNEPKDCSTVINKRWMENRDVLQTTTENHGRTFVDTGMWFCDSSGYCPAVIGDYIPRRDERHLTFDYAEFLAPLVAAWVLGS